MRRSGEGGGRIEGILRSAHRRPDLEYGRQSCAQSLRLVLFILDWLGIECDALEFGRIRGRLGSYVDVICCSGRAEMSRMGSQNGEDRDEVNQ